MGSKKPGPAYSRSSIPDGVLPARSGNATCLPLSTWSTCTGRKHRVWWKALNSESRSWPCTAPQVSSMSSVIAVGGAWKDRQKMSTWAAVRRPSVSAFLQDHARSATIDREVSELPVAMWGRAAVFAVTSFRFSALEAPVLVVQDPGLPLFSGSLRSRGSLSTGYGLLHADERHDPRKARPARSESRPSGRWSRSYQPASQRQELSCLQEETTGRSGYGVILHLSSLSNSACLKEERSAPIALPLERPAPFWLGEKAGRRRRRNPIATMLRLVRLPRWTALENWPTVQRRPEDG